MEEQTKGKNNSSKTGKGARRASLVLGIETSCDETSVAVVGDSGSRLLSNTIHSQIADHAPFHGVVPEIASRAHLEKIGFVLEDAIARSGCQLSEIDLVAVSTHPGLTGSLMIGANLAKSLSLVYGTPVLGINHIEAHLYAPCLEGYAPEYPFLGLLLSGGNSAIFRVEAPGSMFQICDTMDDAIGEAFDKAASLLGLPYPGGPAIEKLARKHAEKTGLALRFDEKQSLFTRLLKNQPRTELAFSFSGIKTAVRKEALSKEHPVERIAFDFQNTVFELVERVLVRAIAKAGLQRVVAAGGVLANETLRALLEDSARKHGYRLVYPKSKLLCTDNAAMVAALGARLWTAGAPEAGLGFDVSSRKP